MEIFHDTQAEFGDRGDGYVSRTIALANCCPPLRLKNKSAISIYLKIGVNDLTVTPDISCVICRSFVERCRQCDPQGSEDSAQRANASLDRMVNQAVRVLTDRLFEHIRVRKQVASLVFPLATFLSGSRKIIDSSVEVDVDSVMETGWRPP